VFLSQDGPVQDFNARRAGTGGASRQRTACRECHHANSLLWEKSSACTLSLRHGVADRSKLSRQELRGGQRGRGRVWCVLDRLAGRRLPGCGLRLEAQAGAMGIVCAGSPLRLGACCDGAGSELGGFDEQSHASEEHNGRPRSRNRAAPRKCRINRGLWRGARHCPRRRAGGWLPAAPRAAIRAGSNGSGLDAAIADGRGAPSPLPGRQPERRKRRAGGFSRSGRPTPHRFRSG